MTITLEKAYPLRTVRSYVRRAGRISEKYKQALQTHWQQYGLEPDGGLISLEQTFKRTADCYLEIGFGMGDALLCWAKQHPEINYIGIDVHLAGLARVINLLNSEQLTNVRLFNHDAVEVLKNCIPPASLAKIYILFPDPWHKARHHKRRLIQTEFISILAQALKPQGILHLATDWEDYAQHMLQTVDAHSSFINVAGQGQFSPRPADRPLTKFEQRGERLGHGVWDLIYQKK